MPDLREAVERLTRIAEFRPIGMHWTMEDAGACTTVLARLAALERECKAWREWFDSEPPLSHAQWAKELIWYHAAIREARAATDATNPPITPKEEP